MGERSNPNSKAYITKCRKMLESLGAPTDGWRCINVFDIKEAKDDGIMFQCELCGCPSVRFAHVMAHEKYQGFINVGCICAGFLEGNLFKAKKREKAMKNRARRRELFPYRICKVILNLSNAGKSPVGYQFTYKRHKIVVGRLGGDDSKYGYTIDKGPVIKKNNYKSMDYLQACRAAFDKVDPIENIVNI